MDESWQKSVVIMRRRGEAKTKPKPRQHFFRDRWGMVLSDAGKRERLDFFNVLYESRCMWSVSYHALRTVSENAYVKCGL